MMIKRILGVLFSAFLLMPLTFNVPQEETPVEIIDTMELPSYLTDEELSLLYTCKQEVRKESKNIVELSQAEAMLLMQVGRCEGGTTEEGQLWAMRTIYNRLVDGWGNSLWEILTDEDQFTVVLNGSYKKADINVESHLALVRLEAGENPTQGALYWESNSNSPNSWHKQNLTFIKEVEGNLYYK